MNWFLDFAFWQDWSGGASPPIYWNSSTGRYEILVSDPVGGAATFHIQTNGAITEDGVIDFTYDISSMIYSGGYLTAYINIIRNGEEVIHSVDINNNLTGRVTVPVTTGNTYSIVMNYDSGSYYSGGFYEIDALITPYAEAAPTVLPWWLYVS